MLNKHIRAMVKLYKNDCDLSVDQLPYTEEFEKLYKTFRRETKVNCTRAEFWRVLTNQRKKGMLPKKPNIVDRSDAKRPFPKKLPKSLVYA